MRVTSKMVRRYYLDGKGYATKVAAYRVLAQREIAQTMADLCKHADLDEATETLQEKFVNPWFKEKFPHIPDPFNEAYCANCWRRVSERAFCNTARHRYLTKRAKELMALDEAG